MVTPKNTEIKEGITTNMMIEVKGFVNSWLNFCMYRHNVQTALNPIRKWLILQTNASVRLINA